ncbi:MAG: macro domain-containing protein [Deltaproteobacteria bacterium]|nr:macro domain-containing protein [Deltaproteobacteria bacterium]
MIDYKVGDLLANKSEALVNTVNCVGVMGRGIALLFKKSFPDNFKFYKEACKLGKVEPGKMLVYEVENLCNPKYIINFPTKRHWHGVSRIEDIKLGLIDLVNVIKLLNIKSIAVPPLGCGLGGLNWNDVKPCIEMALSQLQDVQVVVYEPGSTPNADTMVRNRAVPKMTSGRAALVTLIQRYLDGLLDSFVTLLEIHKLMYFLQECGEPLRLRYVKAPYGPYAENLSHVLRAIDGHFLCGYADGGDVPDKQITVVPGVERDALVFLDSQPQTTDRINLVAELVDGFETPFGMELLSTVHWVMKREGAVGNEIANHTYAWDEKKRKFSQRQIEIAANHLVKNGC